MDNDELIELVTTKAAIKYDLLVGMKHLRGRHDQKLHGNRGAAAGVERSLSAPPGATERGKIQQSVFEDVKGKLTSSGRSWSGGRRKYTWDYISWVTGGKSGASPDAKTYGEDVPRAANHIRRLVEGNAQIKALGAKRETPPKAAKPAAEAPKPEAPKPASEAPSLEGKPAGDAMGGHYDFSKMTKGGEIRKGIDNALAAMETVHGDGGLRAGLPILKGASAGGIAAFWHYGATASKITFARNESTGNSFAHESGHFIDHGILGPGKPFGISSADSSGPPGFSEARRGLWDAIRGSETYQRIMDGATGKIPAKKFPVSDYMKDLYPDGKAAHIDSKYLMRYFGNNKEVIARAYAQYIAVRSKNPIMMKEVRDYQKKQEGDTYEAWMEKHNQPMVWQDKEFEPIANAFDQLFANVGWRK